MFSIRSVLFEDYDYTIPTIFDKGKIIRNKDRKVICEFTEDEYDKSIVIYDPKEKKNKSVKIGLIVNKNYKENKKKELKEYTKIPNSDHYYMKKPSKKEKGKIINGKTGKIIKEFESGDDITSVKMNNGKKSSTVKSLYDKTFKSVNPTKYLQLENFSRYGAYNNGINNKGEVFDFKSYKIIKEFDMNDPNNEFMSMVDDYGDTKCVTIKYIIKMLKGRYESNISKYNTISEYNNYSIREPEYNCPGRIIDNNCRIIKEFDFHQYNNSVCLIKNDDLVVVTLKELINSTFNNVSVDGINWLYINDFDNQYAISRKGKIFSFEEKEYVKSFTDRDGYTKVVFPERFDFFYRVDYLVYKTFIDDSIKFSDEIIHIDENMNNNCADNLKLKRNNKIIDTTEFLYDEIINVDEYFGEFKTTYNINEGESIDKEYCNVSDKDYIFS